MSQPFDSIALAAELAPLSDVDGRIAHVFLALPAYDAGTADALLASFRGIRGALGTRVRCTLLHHPAHAEAVRSELGDVDSIEWEEGFVLRLRDVAPTVAGSTLRVTRPALMDFTTWVQDAFLVATGTAAVAQVWASPHVKRSFGGWDDAVPRHLAAHLGWPYALLPCGVEAGNILIGGAAALVGADVPRATSEELWEALVGRLSMRRRRVLVPGADRAQPVFHLDLYVTLAGPDAATGQPLALVGSIESARKVVGAGNPVGIEDGLDAVAADLTRAGFVVARMPMLPFESPYLPEAACYTYNNCLVEVWAGSRGQPCRRVTLPSYGADGGAQLEALDAAAAEVWAGLGFEVRFARGEFARLAALGGSLRCMTKVLERN